MFLLDTGRHLRKLLREEAFMRWSALPHKGKGVITYQQDPKANAWFTQRKGLSSSEWTNSIKMSCNTAAVRTVPGRAPSQSVQCRQPGCQEIETLGHVLGFCMKGELQQNSRHHKVRSLIASKLRTFKWEVYEEIQCLATDGSIRRVDIVALDRHHQKALILDPTVRMEQNEQQAIQVDQEKKSIYIPCIPHLSERYNLPVNAWDVKGLLFGARGTSFKFTSSYLQSLSFTYRDIVNISTNVLRDSLSILHNHLYLNS